MPFWVVQAGVEIHGTRRWVPGNRSKFKGPQILQSVKNFDSSSAEDTCKIPVHARSSRVSTDPPEVSRMSIARSGRRAVGLVRDLVRRGEPPKPLVAVRSLSAQRVEVTAKGSADAPARPPESLALPVRVDIASVRVGELVHASGSRRVSIADIEGRVASDGQTHSLALASLVHARGSASGELAVGV